MTRRLTRNKRIGLFGGTFDPVHLGHINIGKNLYNSGIIEQIIFLPAGVPPHKLDLPITPANHRLAMLSLALEKYENFHISSFEINHANIAYSINTARHFSRYFGKNLFLIIGMDSLCELSTWRNAKKLVSDFNFIVYRRPNSNIPDEFNLTTNFGKTAAEKLYDSIVEGDVKDISSTVIRNLIRRGNDASPYLSPEVLRYINENQLYRD